jgi:phospholipase/lecithinase/hemolysin
MAEGNGAGLSETREWATCRASQRLSEECGLILLDGGTGVRQIAHRPRNRNTSHVSDRAKTYSKRNGGGTSPAVAVRRKLGGNETMRIVAWKPALVAVFLLAFMPVHASLASGRLQVVVFGDSLLDAGTYSPVAELLFGGGRYTTNPGLNFTQDVARYYGDNLTPAFLGGFGVPLFPAGGLDYAQGGSRVMCQPGIDHAPAGTKNADFAEATTIPVSEQVTWYLSAHGNFTPHQLVLINGGANDVFFQLAAAQATGNTEAALQAILQSASDLANIVATVVANGATHVAVFNLPDIGITPLGLASPTLPLTAISQLFNSTLATALQQMNFGDKVIILDAFSFIDGIVANYQTYGFAVSNNGLACNLSAQIARAQQLHLSNPTLFGQSLFCSRKTYTAYDADYTFMFADTVHPTTHLNLLVANFVEQQIGAKGWQFQPDETAYSSVQSEKQQSP